MQIISWNAELAIANMQFKRLFSNIRIERTDAKTKAKSTIKVDCKLDQRSRILKNWENAEKRAAMTLPMITISRTGYSRSPERVNNIHNEVKYEITSKNRNENLLTPIPVDISYDVTVLAKYPSDIDQIASNFMVFFNSDVYVQCQHPKYEGLYMNNQVVLGDQVSEEHPSELDGTMDDLITTTFNFTFKTYLFGGTQKAKRAPQKVLSTFISTYISTDILTLQPDEIVPFHQQHPELPMSVLLSAEVTGEVTAFVDNPDVSSQVYEGFTPIINQLCVGFYPVPYLCSDMAEHVWNVDNIYTSELCEVSGYYSSSRKNPFELSVNSDGLSVRVPEKEWMEPMFSRSTLDPYVDRLHWVIDEDHPLPPKLSS